MTILFVVTCMMNVRDQRDNRLSQALVHFVIDRASLFTDHRISGRPERISILLLLNDGRRCMEFILCRVVESSCLPTHNIVPTHFLGMAFHVTRTTKKYADFPSMVIFQLLLRKVWIQTCFCNWQQHLCLFHVVFEYIPGIHGQGMMLVSPQINFFV